MLETIAKRDYDTEMQRILRLDLSFKGQRSTYGPHSLHAFAAKFPPQLPRMLIEALTEPGEIVCDVMAGSGTTLVEALLANRCAIGLDIDPLAIMIAKAKTTQLGEIGKAPERVLHRAGEKRFNPQALSDELEKSFNPGTRKFVNYWFFPEASNQLMALSSAIRVESDYRLRTFLQVVLSSIIVTKSGGVSRARDLAHSRPHLDPEKKTKDPMELFPLRLKKCLEAMKSIESTSDECVVIRADTHQCPLRDESVHLIVTSPPYANAIDYMRAHKFSLVWLGFQIERLSRLRAEYVGSERVREEGQLPREVIRIVKKVSDESPRKGAILGQYFGEMYDILSEMKRILVKNRYAVLVVGPSVISGIPIRTHRYLTAMARNLGFEAIGIRKRRIDRDRRMLPIGRRPNGSGIEQRIYGEYLIALKKT